MYGTCFTYISGYSYRRVNVCQYIFSYLNFLCIPLSPGDHATEVAGSGAALPLPLRRGI